MDNAVLIAIIGSSVTGVGVLISLFISINTARMAARKDMIQVLQEDNDILRKENRDLNLRIDAQEHEIFELRVLVEDLKNQIKELGGIPKTPGSTKKKEEVNT